MEKISGIVATLGMFASFYVIYQTYNYHRDNKLRNEKQTQFDLFYKELFFVLLKEIKYNTDIESIDQLSMELDEIYKIEDFVSNKKLYNKVINSITQINDNMYRLKRGDIKQDTYKKIQEKEIQKLKKTFVNYGYILESDK